MSSRKQSEKLRDAGRGPMGDISRAGRSRAALVGAFKREMSKHDRCAAGGQDGRDMHEKNATAARPLWRFDKIANGVAVAVPRD